jgi:hypothetical protein
MKTETYNGWTNYSTWRVNLELFDSMNLDEAIRADTIKELAEDIIFRPHSKNSQLVEDYARAFLDDVNWHEIAEHLNERIEA